MKNLLKIVCDVYMHSEVINILDMKLDENFTINHLPNNRITGVCTQCAPNMTVNEYGEVEPNFINLRDSQESSQSSSSSQPSGVNTFPIFSPYNLFCLDLFDDDNVKLFMNSLTAAELLVITPVHLFINVFRCRATQIPFSKGSSIGFPLQKEMIANQLPWSDFANLPFIVMVYDSSIGVPKQAK